MNSMKKLQRRFKLYERCVRHHGWVGFKALAKSFLIRRPVTTRIWADELGGWVSVRIPSSDVLVYRQIVRNHAYDLPYNFTPRTIVDLGSNVGLSVRYFARRFPDCRVICVEADPENVPLLKKNVADVNAVVYHNAVWSDNQTVLRFTKPRGDNWGGTASTVPSDNTASTEQSNLLTVDVQSISIDQIITEQSIDTIDILKVDIEGAERELFANPASWIDRVRCVIVELHDYNSPGASDAVMSVLKDKRHKKLGENEVFWDEGMFTGF